MLSRSEWERKHANRLRGVSAADRKERYRQYRETRENASVMRGKTSATVSGTRDHSSRTPEAVLGRVAARTQGIITSSPFMKALMDPFDSHPVRVPEPDPRPTAVSKVTFTVPVYSCLCADGVGRAFAIVRPCLDNCYAISSTGSDLKQTVRVGSDTLPQAVFNAREADVSWHDQPFPDPSALPLHTDGAWAVTNLAPIPLGKAELMRNLYTRYRATACGVQFKYSNRLIEARGDMVTANLPGTYGLPSVYNYLFTMNSAPGVDLVKDDVFRAQGFPPSELIGLNFQTAQSLEGAVVGAAVHGSEAVWIPNWDVLSTFRPTRTFPPTLSPLSYAQAMPGGSFWNGVTNCPQNLSEIGAGITNQLAEMPLPLSCSNDPADFCSFMQGLFDKNLYCHAFEVAGAPNLPNAFLGPLVTGMDATGFGADAGQNMDTVNSNVIYTIHAYQNTAMASGDEAIVMCWEGVPLNDTGDGGAEIGTLTVTMHFEGTVNSRTLALESDSVHLTSAPVSETNLAKLATHVVPRVIHGSEGRTGSHTAERITKTANNILDGVHTAVKAAPGIISKGKQIWETVAPILEGFGLAAAL
jgi:hypothetical protein